VGNSKGMAVSYSSPQLSHWLKLYIASIHENGFLNELKKKYIGGQ